METTTYYVWATLVIVLGIVVSLNQSLNSSQMVLPV